MAVQSKPDGQGAEHELARATVYGFGLGQQSRQARLTVHWSDKENSIVVTHELQHRRRQAGLEWHEEDVLVVQPTEQRDREVIQPGYSEFPDSRVVCEWNDHAPRAYVRHEERHNGDWIPVAGWEIHAATGIDAVYGGDDGGE